MKSKQKKLMMFKEQFHGAVCSVQRETTTFHFRKNKVQMIFEVSESNIKILDILFSEKLQIT